jgi:hypothetical protein
MPIPSKRVRWSINFGRQSDRKRLLSRPFSHLSSPFVLWVIFVFATFHFGHVVSMREFHLNGGNSAHTTTTYLSYLLAYHFILRCIY